MQNVIIFFTNEFMQSTRINCAYLGERWMSQIAYSKLSSIICVCGIVHRTIVLFAKLKCPFKRVKLHTKSKRYTLRMLSNEFQIDLKRGREMCMFSCVFVDWCMANCVMMIRSVNLPALHAYHMFINIFALHTPHKLFNVILMLMRLASPCLCIFFIDNNQWFHATICVAKLVYMRVVLQMTPISTPNSNRRTIETKKSPCNFHTFWPFDVEHAQIVVRV